MDKTDEITQKLDLILLELEKLSTKMDYKNINVVEKNVPKSKGIYQSIQTFFKKYYLENAEYFYPIFEIKDDNNKLITDAETNIKKILEENKDKIKPKNENESKVIILYKSLNAKQKVKLSELLKKHKLDNENEN